MIAGYASDSNGRQGIAAFETTHFYKPIAGTVVQAQKSAVGGHPQAPCFIFMNTGNVIAGQTVGIVVVMPVNGKAVAVETVQPIFGGDPDEAIPVFQNGVDGI